MAACRASPSAISPLRRWLSSVSDRVLEQPRIARVTAVVGAADLYLGDERVGAALRRAHDDALAWIAIHR